MQRRIIFNADDLLRLLTHYTDGLIPADAEMREFMVSPLLEKFVGMWVRSSDWSDLTPSTNPQDAARGVLKPIHVRYEGRKVMNLTGPLASPEWKESPDAPNRQ